MIGILFNPWFCSGLLFFLPVLCVVFDFGLAVRLAQRYSRSYARWARRHPVKAMWNEHNPEFQAPLPPDAPWPDFAREVVEIALGCAAVGVMFFCIGLAKYGVLGKRDVLAATVFAWALAWSVSAWFSGRKNAG